MTIDASSVDRWVAAVDASVKVEIKKFMNLALVNSATIVQHIESAEAPRGATNKLAKSIKQFVTEIAATIGPDHDLDYAKYVELGTKPHMPPVSALQDWAQSKGINPWAVAMSIKKKGTKANPFVKRTYELAKPEVILEFQTASKLITEFLAKA